MRLVILVSFIVASLAATTGCSVSGQAARHASADTSNDPSWTPPGETNLAIGEAHPCPQTVPPSAEVMPQPNKREIVRGQLHAATY